MGLKRPSSLRRRLLAKVSLHKTRKTPRKKLLLLLLLLLLFVVSHGVAGHAHAPARSPVPRAPSPRSTDAVRDGGRDERQHRLDGDVVRHRGFVSIDPTGREGRNGNDDKV